LNDPQFVEAARVLAEQSFVPAEGQESEILNRIFQRVVARPAGNMEEEILMADYQHYLAHYRAHPEDAQALTGIGETKANPDLPPAQLAAWTIIANQVLNLDESLNK